MATDMERAYDDDAELVYRCDGCGGVVEPWDAEPPVIYDCFHVLHAGCAHGRDDACPRCHKPRLVHVDDDDPPEPVDDAPAPASPPPDNNSPDEDISALASDDASVGMGDGETGEPRPSQCGGEFNPGNGESPASMSGSGCNHASRLGCCACRVAELESRFQEKSAALTETTNVLEVELERARSRLCRLEEMCHKLEEELIRVRDGPDGKRPAEIEDAGEERKKPRNG